MNSIISRLPNGESRKFNLNGSHEWISEDQKFKWFQKPFLTATNKGEYSPSQEEYIHLVEKAKSFMRNGSASKIVLSRISTVPLLQSGNSYLYELYDRLEKAYPSAFVFLYPESADVFWLGATPELLLSKKENFYKTVSLAGTRPKGVMLEWGKKEKAEQGIVTEYILSTLKENGAKGIHSMGPFTAEAGSIEHLKTELVFQSELMFEEWVQLLHPTPAICGFPRNTAMKFILENEFHDRTNYSGVLGWQSESEIHLYVQLRTMKVDFKNKVAHIYAGGGIMQESDSLSEWEETEKKAMVMKSVLF